MTEFKVGDRVRLKGEDWDEFKDQGYGNGTIHAVTSIANGEIYVHPERYYAIYPEDGFDAELISGNSEEAIKNRSDHFEELAQVAEKLGISSFEENVRRILNGVADTVASKNLAYGDSALNPIRVFSKADRMEQLFVRLDDKLSRVQKGHEYPGDDTIRDIIGYCTLILIARESQ